MRFLMSFSLGVVLLSSSTGLAMSQSLPKAIKDELISRSVVHAPFSMVATDGAAIQFQTDSKHAESGLKNLPPEKGASHSSCGAATGDIDLIISLSQVTLRLVQNGTLSSADSKILQAVPRCEPYLQLLGSIGSLMNPSSIVEQDLPAKLSVIKTKSGMALQVAMKSGRTALFRISDKVKGVESAKDLAKVRLDASTTGQNIGVSFIVTDGGKTAPIESRGHESCTIYETVQRCDHGDRDRGDRSRDRGDRGDRDDKRSCRSVVETRPGHRRTVSRSTFTSYKIDLALTAANGSKLLTAELSDGDFDTRTREGECYPDDRRR